MMNSSFFAQPLGTIQLLSVFSHLNTLNDFLYGHHILAEKDQFKPIPIVNSLYEYFQQNENDTLIKANLAHRLLANTDLYGANKNKTIDSDYVNIMFDYIIGHVVFGKYGNIYGFLTETMIKTDNVTLPSFKEKLRYNLRISYYTNEDGTVSFLSDSAVEKITEELIFPLFPEVENNVSVISPDYMLAQAGLTFIRAVNSDINNFTYSELIGSAQVIELLVHEAQIDNTVLRIFTIPATLYYSNTKKDLFKKDRIANLVKKTNYWITVYDHLFTYLNSIFGKLQEFLRKTTNENPQYALTLALSTFKNRTQLAEENIRKYCHLLNENNYKTEIDKYKDRPDEYHCGEKNLTLPNINEIFDEQNEDIADKYSIMEKRLIEEAYGNSSIRLFNNLRQTIYKSKVKPRLYNPLSSDTLPFYEQEMKGNVDLFEAFTPSSGRTSYFALIRENNKINLVTDQNLHYLRKRIGAHNYAQFKRIYSLFTRPIKRSNETFNTFATRVARERADLVKMMLYKTGYDATNWEVAMRILLGLIPFYNCVQDLKQGETTTAVIDCGLELVTLIPVYGTVVVIGTEILSKALLESLGTSIESLIFRETILQGWHSIGKSVLKNLATGFSEEFTKETFKTLGISLVRALDPGFEFLGRLSISGIKNIIGSFSLLKNVINPSFYYRITNTLKKLENQVGKFELRKVHELQREVPVKLEKIVDDSRLYRRVKLETRVTSPVRHENIMKISLLGTGKTDDARMLSKRMKEINDQIAVNILKLVNIDEVQARKLLNQYFFDEDKTQIAFVFYWSLQRRIPPWIMERKLEDPETFWRLRHEVSLVPHGIHKDVAYASLTELYGEDRLDVIGVDVGKAISIYNGEEMYKNIMFEDFFAIYNYLTFGYKSISEYTDEAMRMRNALYRLAIRQSIKPRTSTKVLYRGEVRDLAVASTFTEGSVIELNRFTAVTLDHSIAMFFVQDNLSRLLEEKISLIYEIELEGTYLAANINKIFITGESELVLLPGVKLIIVRVEDILIYGKAGKKIFAKNQLVDKSQWLLHLMKQIQILKAGGTRFYYLDPI